MRDNVKKKIWLCCGDKYIFMDYRFSVYFVIYDFLCMCGYKW